MVRMTKKQRERVADVFKWLNAEGQNAAPLLRELTDIARNGEDIRKIEREQEKDQQKASQGMELLRRYRLGLELKNPGGLDPKRLKVWTRGMNTLEEARKEGEAIQSVAKYLRSITLEQSDEYRNKVTDAVSGCATVGGYLFELLNDERTKAKGREMVGMFEKLAECVGYIVEVFGYCQG